MCVRVCGWVSICRAELKFRKRCGLFWHFGGPRGTTVICHNCQRGNYYKIYNVLELRSFGSVDGGPPEFRALRVFQIGAGPCN